MKKITLLLSLLTFLLVAAHPQVTHELLGTPGVTMDPADVPMFQNDLPVIRDLQLRIDLTAGTPDVIPVEMLPTTQDLLGIKEGGVSKYMTKVWGYKFPGKQVTYPGATIVAMKDMRVNIRWLNNLTGQFLPVDASLHMAHPSNLVVPGDPVATAAAIRAWYAAGNVPTVTHLHGGHTESASDGIPEAWFTQGFNETGAFFQKKNYRYDNNQESATLWYHDHALGITRLNVYAGLAGFYLLRDNNELALINNGTLPGGEYEIEMVIQDRLFRENGELFWPANPDETPYNDFIYVEGAILPPSIFPDPGPLGVVGGPSALAEFFGNIILVNGKAWPRLEVEPRKYRFRLLNGSDSRFYILKLSNGKPIMVIGSDDGLLQTPANTNELVIAPGERYDVVIDFAGMQNTSVTLLNTGPDEPYNGGVEGFEPSDPGTTGQIMRFDVTKALNTNVAQASVAVGTPLNQINPLVADNAGNPRQLALFEGNDEFGRLQPMLGTLADGSLTWSDPITENPKMNSTEIWEVYNSTGDAHPIHLHLVKFQILDREKFDFTAVSKPQIQHNGETGTGFILTSAVPNGTFAPLPDHEKGWKDTFIVPPGYVGRLVATFDRTGRYVWHCHILSHEDHEMMRVLQVGPIPPATMGKKKGASVDQAAPDQFGEFRLYPNPASDMTTVEFVLAEAADVRISIYGMDGRMINSEELGHLNDGPQSIAVPVGHLDNGMYLLEVKAGNKLFRESFIVNK